MRTGCTAHGKGTAHCSPDSALVTAHGKAKVYRYPDSKAAAFEVVARMPPAFPCAVDQCEVTAQ